MRSTLAPMCKSRYSSAFCSGGCEKYKDDRGSSLLNTEMRKISEAVRKILRLLWKIFSAVPERIKEELEPILGKKFMGYASGKFSDFERQKQKESTATGYNAVYENVKFHRVMMEVEPLLEASAKRNWRSIMWTFDEFPYHCLLQTWCYHGRSNLGLIWDCGKLFSMGLPDSSQTITKRNSGSYDGDTMAGSSCERKQSTRNADERTVAGIGISKRLRSF